MWRRGDRGREVNGRMTMKNSIYSKEVFEIRKKFNRKFMKITKYRSFTNKHATVRYKSNSIILPKLKNVENKSLIVGK